MVPDDVYISRYSVMVAASRPSLQRNTWRFIFQTFAEMTECSYESEIHYYFLGRLLCRLEAGDGAKFGIYDTEGVITRLRGLSVCELFGIIDAAERHLKMVQSSGSADVSIPPEEVVSVFRVCR